MLRQVSGHGRVSGVLRLNLPSGLLKEAYINGAPRPVFILQPGGHLVVARPREASTIPSDNTKTPGLPGCGPVLGSPAG